MAISLIVIGAALGLAGFLWEQGHTVPPHVVLRFPTAHTALWISGETRTESVTVKQGNPIVTVKGRESREITVRGAGALRYKDHLIVVLENDVQVDGSSLRKSNNWVLFPDGRLVQGFIRTFD